MKKYSINAGIIFSIIVGILFIFLWLISSSYSVLKYKPYQVDTQRVIKLYQEISRAIENNQGKMDLTNITDRDDWDRFCLVIAYLSIEPEPQEFIRKPSSIRYFLPDNHDDGFGIGILFVKDKEIIESIHIPRHHRGVPASSDVGEYVKSISRISSTGSIVPPYFVSNSAIPDNYPKPTCYTHEYTIKMHKDWTYSILKKGNNDE